MSDETSNGKCGHKSWTEGTDEDGSKIVLCRDCGAVGDVRQLRGDREEVIFRDQPPAKFYFVPEIVKGTEMILDAMRHVAAELSLEPSQITAAASLAAGQLCAETKVKGIPAQVMAETMAISLRGECKRLMDERTAAK